LKKKFGVFATADFDYRRITEREIKASASEQKQLHQQTLYNLSDRCDLIAKETSIFLTAVSHGHRYHDFCHIEKFYHDEFFSRQRPSKLI
jgi:hypothetical protein